MFKNYLKIAFRNIQKYKGYSFINIFGLATGIALSLMIFMYVQHETGYDSFHEHGERIYKVTSDDGEEIDAVLPSMVAPTLASNFADVEQWLRIYSPTRFSPIIVNVDNNLFQENSFYYADSSFFDLFSYEFVAGDPSTALNRPRTVVLTESTARKLFGNQNGYGKEIEARVFGRPIVFEVTGIIKDLPSNTHLNFDYLGSLSTRNNWPELSDNELKSSNFFTYIKLTEQANVEEVAEQANELLDRFIPEERQIDLLFTKLPDVYLEANTSGDIEPLGNAANIYGFSALALLIFFIAVINYINLATARSARRAPEVGVRKSLGAHKSQLIKQFYGESFILTLISMCLAIGIVELGKDPFFSLLGKPIDISLFTDTSVWFLFIGIALITALAAGSYPAFHLSSYEPSVVLKGLNDARGSGRLLRKGLITFQFAVSVFLILGTIIIYQQTDFILTKNLGFNKEQVVILPVQDRELSPKHDILKQEILRQNGVVGATYMSNIPGNVFGGYMTEHAPTGERTLAAAGAADPDVVEIMGFDLLAGEGFTKNPAYDIEQGYVYLLNETLASAYGWEPSEAIGKDFNALGGRLGKVVGVIKDFHYASLAEEINPMALFMDKRMNRYLMVKIDGQNVASTLGNIEQVWQSMAPHRPFEFDFLDSTIDALYANEIRTRNIFFVFAVLAIVIASLGLFGLSAYMVERRTKEIGIRKVLGATLADIVQILFSEFLKLVLLSFIIAIPFGWYFVSEWLQEFAYRIDISVWVFIATGFIAILIALATVSYQSVKVGMTNPVDSLKSD